MRARFRNSLLLLAPAVFAASLAECAAVAWRAEGGRGAVAIAAALWRVFSYSALGCLGLSIGLGLLLALLGGLLGAAGDAPLALAPGLSRSDVAAALLVAGPAFAAFAYAVVLSASRSFSNQELSALLVLLVLLGGALAALGLALGLLRPLAAIRKRFEARRAASALPFVPGVLVLFALVAVLIRINLRGLAQLDARLWLAPGVGVALCVCLGLLRVPSRIGPASARRGLAALGAASVLAGGARALVDPLAANVLVENGAWSRLAIRAARAATDFDGDGYSSFFAGGDCAPFDPAVHPGAREIFGDGIDNNCIGGDAREGASVRHPQYDEQLPATVPERPNLVVVTIETLRRDHVSFLGYRRPTTPELEALAPSAIRFSHMYSAAPMTRLAVASLFSSFAPSEIGWLPQPAARRMRKIAPDTPWLPTLLHAAGYTTLAFLTDFRAFTNAESAGFDRGFDHYDTSTRLTYNGGTMYGFPGEQQVTKAIAAIDQTSGPFFLWLHLFEPHYVYEQPKAAPHFGDDEQARYDAEIWEADRQVGRLIAHLRERGLLDRSVLLVTGDHGEAFGEHADRWHGSNLYDPQVRPAAMLRVPGLAGRRVDRVVSFMDLTPTLLNLLRLRTGYARLRGRNLVPYLQGGALQPDEIVVEAFSVDDGHDYMLALVHPPYKLFYAEEGQKLELFDLERDPQEMHPLERGRNKTSAALESALYRYLEGTARRGVVK